MAGLRLRQVTSERSLVDVQRITVKENCLAGAEDGRDGGLAVREAKVLGRGSGGGGRRQGGGEGGCVCCRSAL